MKFLSKIQALLEDRTQNTHYRLRITAALVQALLTDREVNRLHRLCPVWEMK